MSYLFQSLVVFLVSIFLGEIHSTPFPYPVPVPVPGITSIDMSAKSYGVFQGLKGIKGVSSCGNNTLGLLTGAYLTGCDAAPCIMGRKSKQSLFIEGIFTRSHDNLTAIVSAKVGIIKYSFLTVNACNHIVIGGECPFVPNQKYLFRLDFDLSKMDHIKLIVDMTLSLSVRDEKTMDHICGKFAGRFVD